ncbi:hypothetical protein K3X13_10860 [Aliiroseovarius crassostreae]|uniref:hypothetical protein n=1 Tax=Aliiroseovarius crassostreae TaxID=154981 RepID=UPI0021FAFE58|nr:hypothetical protein [Aliiroseovarius crassostreae]UWP91559.1 hypothetical protein K3X13_10860 [Aliiroseovarius crassostreae]
MQDHEERNDQAGNRRSIRDARPYVFSPYAGPEAPDPFVETSKESSTNKDDRINEILSLVEEKPRSRNFTIMDACAAHVAGAKKSANAKKVFLHGFMQFPTDFKITDRNQRLMLAIAVDFVNQTYGGNAVFHARIDRDEKGRHGVDVFFAPRYEKHTASKGTEQWISLSKFSKENARKRYGKRPKEVKNKKTNKFEPAFGADRKPVMVWNDADVFQGRALQDAWFEHLKAHVGGKYEIERGKPKKGRDPDRLSPEDYAAEQEQQKLLAEVEHQIRNRKEKIELGGRRQEAAAQLIDQAREKAEFAAYQVAESIVADAQKNADAFMDGIFRGAENDARAITQSMLSTDVKEYLEIKEENTRLQAEIIRQGKTIKLLNEVLKTVLPVGLRKLVRSAFDAGWEKINPDTKRIGYDNQGKPDI